MLFFICKMDNKILSLLGVKVKDIGELFKLMN